MVTLKLWLNFEVMTFDTCKTGN